MKIGIVGLGLIGGTIAKALKNKYHLSAYDISESTLEYAASHNIVDKCYRSLDRFFNENDVFFLCLYPNNIINFIFQNKDLFPKNSVVIEISGIKKHLINEVSKLGKLNFDLIYTHPVAGSEKIGVAYSDENIFKKANFVITPVESNINTNLDMVENLAKEMGFGNISYVTPEEHDQIIAYTSQLTHVLSLSLVNALSTNLEASKFIGDSYRDLTRISMINDKLWPELFLSNKEALLSKIDDFSIELDKIKAAIMLNDSQKLSELMQKSTRIRSSIGGKNKDES